MELNVLAEEQSSLFDCFQDPITSIPPLDANASYLQSLATDGSIVNSEYCYLEQYDSVAPFPASLEDYYGDDLFDYSLVPLPDLSDQHLEYSLVPVLPDFSPDPPEWSPQPPQLESAVENRRRSAIGRSKSAREISMEEMRGYFGVPITEAAKKMNVGLTVLKKRCRELGIPRWPHRKMKSLRTLINNVRDLGTDEEVVSKELEELDEYRRQMEENPEIQFTDRTKKLRQACFKANYKKRRLMQDHESFDPNSVLKWMSYDHYQ